MMDAIVWALGMFLFVHFLPQVIIIYELIMIGISAERASPTHPHTAPLLSSPLPHTGSEAFCFQFSAGEA